MVKAGEVEVRGKQLTVELDTHTGKFQYTLDSGSTLHGATREELREKLIKATRAAISVPVIRWKDGKLQRGTITGQHATNHNWLIKWENEPRAEQTYNLYDILQLSQVNAERYQTLCQVRDAAVIDVEVFERNNKTDIASIARKALLET